MQNKELVGSDTSCNSLFAEQTICYSVAEKEIEKWEWYFWLNLPGAGYEERKLPPSFHLYPQYTQPHVSGSLQVCMSLIISVALFTVPYCAVCIRKKSKSS